jgi:pimeloyl-ACP methyl ester carboxylesterase
MSCIQTMEDRFPVEPDLGPLTLRLRHVTGRRRRPDKKNENRAVLMLHGGNSSSETFVLPKGGLAQYLHDLGWDVWLLDYRSSPFVQEKLAEIPEPLGGSLEAECSLFNLDRIVEVDIPAALARLRPQIGTKELSVLGHCIGSGSTALAIARGKLHSVQNVVLSALGLFYEVPWNGWVKAEDFLIEGALSAKPMCRWIDPKRYESWPAGMKRAYTHWPRAWMDAGAAKIAPDSHKQPLLSLLCFMFGQPYFPKSLDPSLTADVIEPVFGNMHIGLYWHIGQMVRRGFAAPFNTPDVITRTHIRRVDPRSGHGPEGDLGSGPNFANKTITLVGGTDNRLWHRDAVDLMYEWLLANARGGTFYKQVHRGYGLQEIMWGANAPAQVFPKIDMALRGEAT